MVAAGVVTGGTALVFASRAMGVMRVYFVRTRARRAEEEGGKGREGETLEVVGVQGESALNVVTPREGEEGRI